MHLLSLLYTQRPGRFGRLADALSLETYYEPGCVEYADLENKFINEDIPKVMIALGLQNDPLPLIWTGDFIPKDPEDGTPGVTEYVVGEFNCSCVGISMFQAVCDGDKTLADVPDADYLQASKLTDLVGVKALEVLQRARETGAAARITLFARFVATRNRALARGPGIGGLLPLLMELAANSRERSAGGALRGTLAARDTVRAIFVRLGSLQKRAATKVPCRWLNSCNLFYHQKIRWCPHRDASHFFSFASASNSWQGQSCKVHTFQA